jgi:hypothetical protein
MGVAMRRSSLAALLALPLALAACARAPVRTSAGRAPAGERVLVTGSRIPQRVDPRSGLPATASPVRVYSREQLAATGRGADLRAALGALDPSIGP